MRLRRSSKLMFHDPLTLVVAPNAQGQASGSIYMDDEITVAHGDSRSYVWRALSFDAKQGVLACGRRAESQEEVSGSEDTYRPSNTVERIVIAGQSRAPVTALLSTAAGASQQLQVIFDEKFQTVTLKKPDVPIAEDWTITFSY